MRPSRARAGASACEGVVWCSARRFHGRDARVARDAQGGARKEQRAPGFERGRSPRAAEGDDMSEGNAAAKGIGLNHGKKCK